MLSCQKDLFRIPPEVTYLNTAYMSPLLRKVEEIGIEAVKQKSLPYEITPPDFFVQVEQLKRQFARLIGTEDWERIAVIPSASYGIASVAQNLSAKAGDKILVVEDQFPSNRYSWMRKVQEKQLVLQTISAPPPSASKGKAWNQALLDAIDARTVMVAIPQVHWSEGILFDLQKIRKKTHEVGALLVLDGTQSVGAYPFSVEGIQPDALVCGGYKWLMGPYSLGLAYYGPAFDGGVPIEENWIHRLNSENFAGLVDYQEQYKPKAHRYSVGEVSNFILVPMLKAAIGQLNDWGAEKIQAYCRDLSEPYIQQLRSIGFGIPDLSQRASHLFGISLPRGLDLQQLKTSLAQQQIYVSIRGNYMRVSPHVFNDETDFERLIHQLSLL